MKNDHQPSRRHFLTAASGIALSYPIAALAIATDQQKAGVPVVNKRVEKAFRAPGKQPNALQATADGLWILDQVDQPGNKAYKVRYTDGSVIHEIATESIHGSGITVGDGALWIGSTWGLKTLKVDPKTGKTLASFDTHGAGMNKFGNPTRPSGAHGLEWVGDKYWIAVPASGLVYQIEPATNKIVHSIPAPGWRTHGLAWVDGKLWCVESTERAIYQMDPKDGKLLAKIQLGPDDPEPHGLTWRDGVFWYCDATSKANSGWVCRLV
jgi:outer membrane protein assembly factor BamB